MPEKPLEDKAERIKALKAEGKTRPQIAEAMGLSVSTVKRLISKFKLGKPAPPKKEKPIPDPDMEEVIEPEEEQSEPPPEWEFTIMERAAAILGDRLKEDYRGYLLDRQPVNSDTVIRAAGLPYPGDPT